MEQEVKDAFLHIIEEYSCTPDPPFSISLPSVIMTFCQRNHSIKIDLEIFTHSSIRSYRTKRESMNMARSHLLESSHQDFIQLLNQWVLKKSQSQVKEQQNASTLRRSSRTKHKLTVKEQFGDGFTQQHIRKINPRSNSAPTVTDRLAEPAKSTTLNDAINSILQGTTISYSSPAEHPELQKLVNSFLSKASIEPLSLPFVNNARRIGSRGQQVV